MEKPELKEEELVGLSEEEKAAKIAEIKHQKELYWKERYKRNIYEFGDCDGSENGQMTQDVAEMVSKGLKKIAELKKQNSGQ